MNINQKDYENFLIEISWWKNISQIPKKLEQTEQEKEHSLFVYMCYVVSWMNKAWDIKKEQWEELEKYWMVTSKKTEDWVEYFITDKAIKYVWWVDDDYKKKVDFYKKTKLIWRIEKDPIENSKDKVNNIL